MLASAFSLSVLSPVARATLEPLSAGESIRLVQALTVIPDPRCRRGRRHGLQSVLLLALQAVMAGASSWVAIAQWATTAPQALGVCGAPPSAATFRRVLAAVDIAAVEAALTGWVTGRQARAQAARPTGTTVAEGRTVVAVDGKTLRGSKDAGSQQTKLVSVYDHAHQLVLTQTAVAAGDEVAAFAAALATLPDLSNVLVTADVLHCQRAHADFLAARGGHYLFTVKSSQPLLRQALIRLTWAQAPGTRRRGRGHGRSKSRSIKVIDLDGTAAHGFFPHGRRAIKVVRRRRIGGRRPSIEIGYVDRGDGGRRHKCGGAPRSHDLEQRPWLPASSSRISVGLRCRPHGLRRLEHCPGRSFSGDAGEQEVSQLAHGHSPKTTMWPLWPWSCRW
jgi:hypothetical protein